MEDTGGVRKGAWTYKEDELLKACINTYGEGKWNLVPQRSGIVYVSYSTIYLAYSFSLVETLYWSKPYNDALILILSKILLHLTGLNRCRKSCRLRWLNYLSPNINRGRFSEDEVDLILRLHKLLGNR